MDINENRKLRFKYLKRVFELANDDKSILVNIKDVGQELGLNNQEIDKIVEYLYSEGLVKRNGGGQVMITHSGIKEVEEALLNPDKPTEHFLPINYTVNVENMTGIIQQGSNESPINYSISKDSVEKIKEVFDDLKNRIEYIDLKADVLGEMVAEIHTVIAQAESPKPKIPIIQESIKTIKKILKSAVNNTTAQLLLSQLDQIDF
ncbi:MAG: hypothetical protein A2W99_10200 [Bacteroidetes bacterium GWF2_33_16]|nr:MAG: hypothetical protein A2X00_05540 [Bacteroidetes bacterium GWE2_32_14]OFY03919.1 MAG: hypothetical protein A2W99_10200 [Bacteroidetes bacterium GWF2_33_16]